MLGAPFRKCKRFIPILLLIILILFIILWRRSQYNHEKPKLYRRFRNNQEEYVDRNGIKVVIGHYVGDPLHKVPNATYDMIHKNHFDPRPDAGKNGNPVSIEPKDLLVMQQMFQINKYNLMASDRIPLNRSLPDVRRRKCTTLYKDYKSYPSASIIIVFHNEAWSALLRTVWSAINRSPRELVKEIILVDDASDREFLKKPLDDYIVNLPIKTRIIRSKNRIGLIKARLKGAEESKGEILTFLDAHCECTTGWLESLISVIHKDRKTVVCPVIDIINDDTLAYVKSFELHWGAFNWNLQFRWFTLGASEMQKRKNDTTEPFNTPAMAGGLFAIDKKYFFEIGSYDKDMNVWGGENLEMSFRVWQCGGQIKIVPCSHVGHIFRKSSPYSFPGGISKTLFSNLARVALVWLDDWANFYFKFNEQARLIRDQQNVTERLELKKRLNCKNFDWYLDNIWPQHFFPTDTRYFGKIRNIGFNLCLMKPERRGISNQPMGVARIEMCIDEPVALQMFVITPEGYVMTDDSVCLDAPEREGIGKGKVRIMACSMHSRQRWRYNAKTKEFFHITNSKCLDVSNPKKLNEGLIITDCTGSDYQKWALEEVPWKTAEVQLITSS